MKRPLQLSLAIALALGGTNALALGLGPVHVKSKLNQPLDAEIPIIQGTAGEAEGLLVNLAAAEDFERVGISRSRLSVPIEFALGKGSNGEAVIKVTSKEPIHDTYLDFLVEANWPKGRLLREYTVLLDPPVMAPARGAATTSAVAAAPAPVTVKRHEAPPATVSTEAPKPAPAPPRAKPAPAPAPTPSVQAPDRKVASGEYGPVAEGETLSGVARAAKVGGVNADQMMLALLKSNPNAFYKDNVNALKRGAILRIPSADEAKAIGSATEAAAQIRSQVEDWRGGRATPTRVADATSGVPAAPVAAATPKAPKATAGSGKAGADEHLALVPPKAGKDSIAMADRPGSGAGSAATSELKSELARTKETLTTREQEAGELKSRVKELEGLKSKNDRLIGLKDSEIAELQQKLKQLQEKSTATTTKPAATTTPSPAATSTPATTPAATTPSTTSTATPPKASATPAATPATPSTTAAAKIDKQDIWGDSGTPPGTKTDATKTPAPSTTPAAAPVTTVTAPAASTGSSMSSPPTSTPSTTTPLATTPPTTPPNSSSTTTASPVSTTTPLDSTPATTTNPSVTPAPAPVAATVTPKPTPKVAPTPSAEWYEASWVKPAALGAGVLLLLGGFLGMRKRKVVPVVANARGSVADSFGDSPLTGSGGGAAGTIEAEETSLREQLQLDPSNIGLHLELLSLYYAERDVARFEDAAADMHAYVEDAHQPEWLEAQAMGQEMAPHNPLFSGGAHFDAGDDAYSSAQADTIERPHLHDHEDFDTAPSRLPAPVVSHADEDLGFNVGHDDFPPKPSSIPAARHDDGFDFTLPPLDLDPPATHVPPVGVAPPKVADLDDDYFPGDDAIGTKLDLAKAYMDMGDPEGARSMLDEVVAEGSDAQKAEAHRLIAEIR